MSRQRLWREAGIALRLNVAGLGWRYCWRVDQHTLSHYVLVVLPPPPPAETDRGCRPVGGRGKGALAFFLFFFFSFLRSPSALVPNPNYLLLATKEGLDFFFFFFSKSPFRERSKVLGCLFFFFFF